MTGTSTWFTDSDGDGYGAGAGAPYTVCDPLPASSAVDGDCDDADPTAYPGAPEQCDAVDHDCDGTPDNGVTDSPWYADVDGDGYGDPDDSVLDCLQPAGRVANNTDCDDALAGVYPGAAEVCDGVDQDCDGVIDDAVTSTFYRDVDMDGYGNALVPIEACALPDVARIVDAPGDAATASARVTTAAGLVLPGWTVVEFRTYEHHGRPDQLRMWLPVVFFGGAMQWVYMWRGLPKAWHPPRPPEPLFPLEVETVAPYRDAPLRGTVLSATAETTRLDALPEPRALRR